MSKKRKSYISSCEISSIESANLGGYQQKIAIEGKSRTSPVVICLHGGPGSPFDAVEWSSAPEKQKSFARNLRLRRTNPSLKEMMTLSKIIRKYTDGYNNHAAKPAPISDMVRGLLCSPDYRLKDFVAIFKNGYMKNESLMREMSVADLSETFTDITVPYHIFQGETDIVTATNDVIKLLDGLHNENVTCTVLPNMGHFPSETAMKEINKKINQLALSS